MRDAGDTVWGSYYKIVIDDVLSVTKDSKDVIPARPELAKLADYYGISHFSKNGRKRSAWGYAGAIINHINNL